MASIRRSGVPTQRWRDDEASDGEGREEGEGGEAPADPEDCDYKPGRSGKRKRPSAARGRGQRGATSGARRGRGSLRGNRLPKAVSGRGGASGARANDREDRQALNAPDEKMVVMNRELDGEMNNGVGESGFGNFGDSKDFVFGAPLPQRTYTADPDMAGVTVWRPGPGTSQDALEDDTERPYHTPPGPKKAAHMMAPKQERMKQKQGDLQAQEEIVRNAEAPQPAKAAAPLPGPQRVPVRVASAVPMPQQQRREQALTTQMPSRGDEDPEASDSGEDSEDYECQPGSANGLGVPRAAHNFDGPRTHTGPRDSIAPPGAYQIPQPVVCQPPAPDDYEIMPYASSSEEETDYLDAERTDEEIRLLIPERNARRRLLREERRSMDPSRVYRARAVPAQANPAKTSPAQVHATESVTPQTTVVLPNRGKAEAVPDPARLLFPRKTAKVAPSPLVLPNPLRRPPAPASQGAPRSQAELKSLSVPSRMVVDNDMLNAAFQELLANNSNLASNTAPVDAISSVAHPPQNVSTQKPGFPFSFAKKGALRGTLASPSAPPQASPPAPPPVSPPAPLSAPPQAQLSGSRRRKGIPNKVVTVEASIESNEDDRTNYAGPDVKRCRATLAAAVEGIIDFDSIRMESAALDSNNTALAESSSPAVSTSAVPLRAPPTRVFPAVETSKITPSAQSPVVPNNVHASNNGSNHTVLGGLATSSALSAVPDRLSGCPPSQSQSQSAQCAPPKSTVPSIELSTMTPAAQSPVVPSDVHTSIDDTINAVLGRSSAYSASTSTVPARFSQCTLSRSRASAAQSEVVPAVKSSTMIPAGAGQTDRKPTLVRMNPPSASRENLHFSQQSSAGGNPTVGSSVSPSALEASSATEPVPFTASLQAPQPSTIDIRPLKAAPHVAGPSTKATKEAPADEAPIPARQTPAVDFSALHASSATTTVPSTASVQARQTGALNVQRPTASNAAPVPATLQHQRTSIAPGQDAQTPAPRADVHSSTPAAITPVGPVAAPTFQNLAPTVPAAVPASATPGKAFNQVRNDVPNHCPAQIASLVASVDSTSAVPVAVPRTLRSGNTLVGGATSIRGSTPATSNTVSQSSGTRGRSVTPTAASRASSRLRLRGQDSSTPAVLVVTPRTLRSGNTLVGGATSIRGSTPATSNTVSQSSGTRGRSVTPTAASRASSRLRLRGQDSSTPAVPVVTPRTLRSGNTLVGGATSIRGSTPATSNTVSQSSGTRGRSVTPTAASRASSRLRLRGQDSSTPAVPVVIPRTLRSGNTLVGGATSIRGSTPATSNTVSQSSGTRGRSVTPTAASRASSRTRLRAGSSTSIRSVSPCTRTLRSGCMTTGSSSAVAPRATVSTSIAIASSLSRARTPIAVSSAPSSTTSPVTLPSLRPRPVAVAPVPALAATPALNLRTRLASNTASSTSITQTLLAVRSPSRARSVSSALQSPPLRTTPAPAPVPAPNPKTRLARNDGSTSTAGSTSSGTFSTMSQSGPAPLPISTRSSAKTRSSSSGAATSSRAPSSRAPRSVTFALPTPPAAVSVATTPASSPRTRLAQNTGSSTAAAGASLSGQSTARASRGPSSSQAQPAAAPAAIQAAARPIRNTGSSASTAGAFSAGLSSSSGVASSRPVVVSARPASTSAAQGRKRVASSSAGASSRPKRSTVVAHTAPAPSSRKRTHPATPSAPSTLNVSRSQSGTVDEAAIKRKMCRDVRRINVPKIYRKLDAKLRQHRIGQVTFATKVLDRSQGTFSESLRGGNNYKRQNKRQNLARMQNFLALTDSEMLALVAMDTKRALRLCGHGPKPRRTVPRKKPQCIRVYTQAQKDLLDNLMDPNLKPKEIDFDAVARQTKISKKSCRIYHQNARKRKR